ncbi:phage head closure protein [Facklamia sp. P9177]|uniref:phage head closure protein n=1 Tax=Facklamia sp. P9177 TaxID=3421945 RepID=UPI003D17103A
MTINDRLFSTRRKKRKLKDKKIQFYQEETLRDKFNSPIGTGLVLKLNNIWAYVRQTSAEEYWRSEYISDQNYSVDLLITINYREGLNNEMIIRYADKLYQITRIDYFEGNKEDILISAKTFKDITDRSIKDQIKDF